MATPVEMPKLGNSVEECLLSHWAKRPGDSVSEGELVAEIETDKATFEVNAPVSGTLLATFFDEGALVPVFTNIFVIGAPGESVEQFRPDGQSAPAAESVAAPAAVIEAPTVATPTNGAPYSPRARRFADQNNFHPADVRGSGPGGRILEQDLRSLFDAAPVGETVSPIRERIAKRMRESLATTAQYTLNSSANAAGLLALRAEYRSSADTAGININDMVAFCAIRALEAMPDLNAEFVNHKIVRHKEVHLGFACDTPRGLMVPVIRNAHRLSPAQLSAAAKELAAKANEGKIAPDDLSGATFTISNLGSLGIETFTPLLNPPQVAILGIGAIQLRPVRAAGGIQFEDFLQLSLTCDHQVIDGAPGARFLRVVKEQIENVEQHAQVNRH
jgi:pyruvate dehydrogenase E2 component (dihydrolipoamide acetyltransferase)